MPDKIKCKGGILEAVRKNQREIIFTGKPMSENEFVSMSGDIVEENPHLIDSIIWILKKIY
jgi:hypothetical protein